jgi:hypothetical protein
MHNTCIHTHPHIHTHAHTYTQGCRSSPTGSSATLCTGHTHTYKHTNTHTHTHTHRDVARALQEAEQRRAQVTVLMETIETLQAGAAGEADQRMLSLTAQLAAARWVVHSGAKHLLDLSRGDQGVGELHSSACCPSLRSWPQQGGWCLTLCIFAYLMFQ